MKRKTGNFGLSLSLDATNSVTFSRPCVAHVEQISSQRVPFHSPPQGLKYQQSLVYTVNFVSAIHLLRNPIWTSKDPGRCLLQWASDSMENCKLFHFSVSFNARKRYRDLFLFSLSPITFQWACLTHWQVVYGISCWKCCVCPFRFQGLLAPTGRRWHLAAVLFLTVLPSSEW